MNERIEPWDERTPAQQKLVEDLGRMAGNAYPDPREAVREQRCAQCGKEAVAFRDELSRKEYAISGLCQPCQDEAFAPPPGCDECLIDLETKEQETWHMMSVHGVHG